jgi:hypothetical protein
MRTLGKVTVIPVIASSLIAVGATAAAANSRNYNVTFYHSLQKAHYNTAAAMRSGPGTGRGRIGTAHQGDRALCIGFTRNGGSVSGNATWSVCSNLSRTTTQGGHEGWTWSPLLSPGF